VSGVIGMPAPAGLVHGMGKELVVPDWSPLTSAEVHTVLARYPQPPGEEMITWRSPRPMSAAGLIRRGGVDLFVKRHHVRVRTPAQLAVEHAFIGHVRARGIPAPAVLRARDGATATQHGDFVYEVHELAGGLDLYRDAVSWTPYTSLGHAHAAGEALAALQPRIARGAGELLQRDAVAVPRSGAGELVAGRQPGRAPVPVERAPEGRQYVLEQLDGFLRARDMARDRLLHTQQPLGHVQGCVLVGHP